MERPVQRSCPRPVQCQRSGRLPIAAIRSRKAWLARFTAAPSPITQGPRLQSGDAEAAHDSYKMSDLFYARTPRNGNLHRAYVATPTGGLLCLQGSGAEALRLIAAPYQHAALRENAAAQHPAVACGAGSARTGNRAAEAQAVRLGQSGLGNGTDLARLAVTGQNARDRVGAFNPRSNKNSGNGLKCIVILFFA